MTNKEASNVLRLFANLIEINGLPEERILTFRKAYEQAISELESDTRPQGEWIDVKDIPYLANCSNCGYQMDTHEEHGYFNYCPYCGADMRGNTKGGAE